MGAEGEGWCCLGASDEYRGHTRGADVSTGEYLWVDFEGPSMPGIPRGQMRPNVSDYSGQRSIL